MTAGSGLFLVPSSRKFQPLSWRLGSPGSAGSPLQPGGGYQLGGALLGFPGLRGRTLRVHCSLQRAGTLLEAAWGQQEPGAQSRLSRGERQFEGRRGGGGCRERSLPEAGPMEHPSAPPRSVAIAWSSARPRWAACLLAIQAAYLLEKIHWLPACASGVEKLNTGELRRRGAGGSEPDIRVLGTPGLAAPTGH